MCVRYTALEWFTAYSGEMIHSGKFYKAEYVYVSLYLSQNVGNVLLRALLTYQWQKPNFNLSKKRIIFFKGKYLFKKIY